MWLEESTTGDTNTLRGPRTGWRGIGGIRKTANDYNNNDGTKPVNTNSWETQKLTAVLSSGGPSEQEMERSEDSPATTSRISKLRIFIEYLI